MIISKSVIEKLNPCKDRFYNFIKHYGDKEFTPRQFMGLKNITHQDKIWVAFRVISKVNCTNAAADIAESVLHIYESQYPGDNRPREAIEAARARVPADAAARAAYYAADADAAARAAYYAARAAYYAADAADLAADHSDADADAAAYYAADATAYYADHAADDADHSVHNRARSHHKKAIRTILLKYLK